MSNWLERIHSLSAGMLFMHGHLLPPPRDEHAPAQPSQRREQPSLVSVGQCCADAARKIIQRPRLIQPH